jgi:hypothetical protein
VISRAEEWSWRVWEVLMTYWEVFTKNQKERNEKSDNSKPTNEKT